MKFRVLGCSGGQVPGHNLSSFLIDDSLLIDAGSATAALSLRAQQKITDILVTHVVPSVAFLIGNKKTLLLHVGDTGPTDEVWSISRKHKKVSAIVLEASFPNRLQELADVSRHLTPQALEREIDKLGMNSVPVLVTHLKPEYRGEIIADLRSLEKRHLKVLKDGDVLRF